MHKLRTNRYVEPYVHQKAVVYSGSSRKKKAASGPKWDLYKSIWAPRAKYADSKDVWDTVEVRRKRFAIVWKRCLDLGLADLVVRMDDGDGDDSADEEADNLEEFGADDDARDDHPEVQDVKRVLWDAHEFFESLFIYYACNEPSSLHSWGMIEWVLFNGEFDVASKKSKHCKTADLDLIFIAVDAKATKVHKKQVEDAKKQAEAERQAASTAKERAMLLKKPSAIPQDDDDVKKSLMIDELMLALVHIAINK